MSSGVRCNCGRKRGDYTDLVVTMRKRNYSPFNGYRCMPSAYSVIECTRPGCSGRWRSKSQYVDDLPDGIPS